MILVMRDCQLDRIYRGLFYQVRIYWVEKSEVKVRADGQTGGFDWSGANVMGTRKSVAV